MKLLMAAVAALGMLAFASGASAGEGCSGGGHEASKPAPTVGS